MTMPSMLPNHTVRLLRAPSRGSKCHQTSLRTPHPQRHLTIGLPRSKSLDPSFPCVDANEARSTRLLQERAIAKAKNAKNIDFRAQTNLGHFTSSSSIPHDGTSGPEPSYEPPSSTGYRLFHCKTPLNLDYGSSLPEFKLAYETWGELTPQKNNVILLHTGLSASSHAKSNVENETQGWWEKFIGSGPHFPIDTNRFFVICTNVLGGCYGSTGPSSIDPTDSKCQAYATRFPIISVFDMVRAQFRLLDELGIEKCYASIGSSMGGMQSVAAAWLEPGRVERIVSISGCARSSPSSIALRYAQRSVLMADPNWNRGFYYDSLPPHTGMKLARQIATITYRSGPEWEQRFARRRRGQPELSSIESSTSQEKARSVTQKGSIVPPVLCPDFLIETYLDHQGEQFCLKYDANSLIYISKAMDLFDLTEEAILELELHRKGRLDSITCAPESDPTSAFKPPSSASNGQKSHVSSLPGPSSSHVPSLSRSLAKLSNHPCLILGTQSDVLFPIEQQRELAEALRRGGNKGVVYYELDSPFGHDTFLIDLAGVGGAIRGFLS